MEKSKKLRKNNQSCNLENEVNLLHIIFNFLKLIQYNNKNNEVKEEETKI